MTWQVRFTELADNDVAETYAWYAAARSGLGEDFLRDLQRGVQQRLRARQRKRLPLIHLLLQAAPFHQFHGDVEDALIFAGVVHNHDVRMRQ